MGRASNRKKQTSRQERLGGRATPRTVTPVQPEDTLKLAITAYHEAGHIVTALAMGHEVTCAWVDMRGRSDPYGSGRLLGYFELEVPPWSREPLRHVDVTPEQAAYFYSRLVVTTAGMVAEQEFCAQRAIRVEPDTTSDMDTYRALFLLLVGCDQEAVGPVLGTAAACATEIVQAHWTVVERLATALAQAGDMDGRAITRVVSDAGGVPVRAPLLPAPLTAARAAGRQPDPDLASWKG